MRTMSKPLINVTKKAVEHLAKLVKTHKKNYVRLSVTGGGCAGFKYDWSFSDTKKDTDEMQDLNGTKLLIDSKSLLFVTGTVLDYKEEIFGSFMDISNPNAKSSCGCGESFGV